MIDTAVAIALGMALLLAALAIRGIFGIVQGKATPTEQKVITAIQPYLYKAILAGQQMALLGLDQFDTKLVGQDKKAVADSVYDTLPDYLLVAGVPIPIIVVKTIVPRDRFEELVKNAYNEAHSFIMKNEAYLRSQVDLLMPPAATSGGSTAQGNG